MEQSRRRLLAGLGAITAADAIYPFSSGADENALETKSSTRYWGATQIAVLFTIRTLVAPGIDIDDEIRCIIACRGFHRHPLRRERASVQ